MTPSHRAAPYGGLAALVQRAADGDEAAFASVYDATIASAYDLALRLLRDPAEAQSVTHEAYLEAWRNAARYDVSSNPVAWILVTVQRLAAVRRSSD